MAPPDRCAAQRLRDVTAIDNVEVDTRDPTRTARLDEVDLMELLGNLIDNAFKYCKSRIDVGAIASADAATVRVTIDDDGPGVPAHQRVQVLARGARGDTATDGHGIGLAVAAELAASYGGALEIETSGLGGARVVVDLPGAGKSE